MSGSRQTRVIRTQPLTREAFAVLRDKVKQPVARRPADGVATADETAAPKES